MTQTNSQPAVTTQASRRVKYGSNVVIAAAATLALVVVLNWIVFRNYQRFDLTSTRQYSLSKQTRAVVKDLKDDYRVVTLFTPYSSTESPVLASYVTQTRDLVEEYGQLSDRITVDHINPARDFARLETFYSQMQERYAEPLQPSAKAINDARQTVDAVRRDATAALAPLRSVLEDPALADGPLKQRVTWVAQAFARFDRDLEDLNNEIKAQLDQDLPHYAGARSLAETLLSEIDSKLLAVAIEHFNAAVRTEGTPASVKDALLHLVERFGALRKQIDATLAALRAVQPVEEYEQLHQQLSDRVNRDQVVVIGPKRVQVLPLTQMYRQPDRTQQQPQQQAEYQFLGEERITGALVSIGMENPPLVVFVSGSMRPAIGPGGQYEVVAQRLRNMNFEVQDWNPMGRMNPAMGRPMPPGPPPEPKAGQKVVWVLLPGDPPNPMNPMAAMGPQQAADFVQRRMTDNGEPALVILMANPMAQFGQGDPIGPVLEGYGITPQLDRVILREVVTPDRQKRPNPQITLDQWPDETAITQAIAGQRGLFMQASPLMLATAVDDKRTAWPLATIQGQDLWAETELTAFPDVKRDENESATSFTVAAAAQKDGRRVVVVADPAFANDQVTSYGQLGPGTAELTGALFPANAELFVNSVYWLSGMDNLIAASARTQDIRRVQAIEPNKMFALQWTLLVAMPMAAAIAGLGVWLARRGG